MATPSSNRRLIPYLFALTGATLVAGGWLAIDRVGIGEGPGRLQAVGWPFGNLPTVAVLGAISGFMYGLAYTQLLARRQAAEEDPPEPAEETESDSLPDLPALANRVGLAHRATKQLKGVRVEVFDLTTEESDGDGGTVLQTRTVVLIPAADLPAFDLQPRAGANPLLAWVGVDGVRFDPKATGSADGQQVVNRFEAAFRLDPVSVETMMSGQVESTDDGPIRRLFTLATMRIALARADWRVQCQGGFLVFWTGTEPLGPKRRERLVEAAVALHSALVAAHSAGTSARMIPLPAGTASPQSQAARFQASVLGALLGTFAGFFVAAVVISMTFFGQPMDQRKFRDGWFALYFFGSIVGGALLGGLIGRVLPLRRPILRKPSDPRREKVVGCAFFVGLVGGFYGGGIVGIVIGELIGLKIDDHATRAGLFFGGVGIGSFLSPMILGMTANAVHRWWTGERD